MIESSAQPCSNQIKRRVVISVCVQAHCSNAKELSSSTSPDTTVWCPEGSLERKLFPFSRRPVIVICVSCRIQIGVSRGLHSAGSSPARAPPSSSRLMILSFSCSTACNDTDTPTTCNSQATHHVLRFTFSRIVLHAQQPRGLQCGEVSNNPQLFVSTGGGSGLSLCSHELPM